MIDDKEIGKRLKERRLGLKLTQEQVAMKLDVDKNQISRWENATRSIASADLPRIAKALYVSPSYFLEEDPEADVTEETLYEPILDEIRVASFHGTLDEEEVQDISDYIRFRSEKKRSQRNLDSDFEKGVQKERIPAQDRNKDL